jgi:uncharacterized protein
MEIISLTIPVALITGLAFGAGPCNVTCLPYLGPVFLKGEGVKKSWRILLPFTLGRLSGYTALGLLAGTAGQTLTELLQSSIAGWILGIAAILVGLNLMRSQSSPGHCNKHHTTKEQTVSFNKHITYKQEKALMPSALFFMGTGMALNPCVPLTAILAAAAASGSAISGLSLGLSFGIGAILIPTFVFGLLVAHFGNELKSHLGHLEKYIGTFSGSLLILLGLATLTGWVQP